MVIAEMLIVLFSITSHDTYFESQNKKTYNVRKVFHGKKEIKATVDQ